ncbi:sensor histidine kinase [Tabrizicola sp.]|uniref:sensor histidine kinase n=1 Tax=Tabrizicola sp. TaxID=2005166 RepID=UPI00286C0725|nr:sensor histidine kinase [Tabrizicola sp.]
MGTLTDLDNEASAKVVHGPPHLKPCDSCFLLQEVYHRIANHFTLLNSFVRLQIADLSRQEHEPNRSQILLLLESIGVQINTIARVNRTLAVTETSAAIDVGAYLHECITPFKTGLYGTVTVSEDFEPGCFLQPEQMLAIGQIVTEVVTNSIKYGHAVEPMIAVHCLKSVDGALLVEVSDNGPGLPAGFDPMTSGGLGFRLLRALSHSLGARTKFESTKPHGLHFQLSVPAIMPPGDLPIRAAIMSSQ